MGAGAAGSNPVPPHPAPVGRPSGYPRRRSPAKRRRVGREEVFPGLAAHEAESPRREPTLLVLAVLSLVVVVPVTLAFGVPVGLLWEDDSKTPAVALGVRAYAVVFLAIFFAVALAAAAAEAFDGRDPGLGKSIGAASKRLGPISTWALMSLTVNLVIALVQERLGAAGAILGGIAGVAWRLATFLVVPVIAFEGLGPVDALKRSAESFASAGASRSPVRSPSALSSASSVCCRQCC